MKTKEEIEQIAEQYVWGGVYLTEQEKQQTEIAYMTGYNQRQEDMIILLRSEIKRAYQYGQINAQMMEVGIERDEIEEYVNYRMLSFKKK